MIKYLFIPITLVSLLNASSSAKKDLDTLLLMYEKENDLSKQTKKESAGNVLVYTRRDLRRMQIKSFSELLKSIPFYRYNENNLGLTDLSYNGLTISTSNEARVYINEREVGTPYFGSGLALLSQLDFEYVDHVEIYYNSTTFEFGIEPAKLVVKLYTKDPVRENGAQIKLSGGLRGNKEASFAFSKVFDNFSLYSYVDRKIVNERSVVIGDTPMRRDKKGTHFFLSLQNDNHRFEYNNYLVNSNLFMQGSNITPTKNNGYANYDLLGWYSTWLDKKLSLSIDYIHLNATQSKSDDEPIVDDAKIENFKIPIYDLYVKNSDYAFSALAKYKDSYKNHNLLIGTYYKHKGFKNKEIGVKIKSSTHNDLIKFKIDNFSLPYDGEDIYGLFFQDSYALSDNQMLIAAFKYDIIDIDKTKANKENLYFNRLGYIYNNKNFTFKSYYTLYRLSFEPFVYFYSKNPSKIKNQKNENMFLEFAWRRDNLKYNLNLFASKESDKILLDYSNSLKPYYKKGVSFSTSYEYDLLNRIEGSVFIANERLDSFDYNDVFYGANIKLLNTFGKFDLYNEIIYRGGYDGLSDGYDYNFAVTYRVNRDFSIYAKGENVFNSAIKTRYHKKSFNMSKDYIFDPISVSSQRFMLGMEYRF